MPDRSHRRLAVLVAVLVALVLVWVAQRLPERERPSRGSRATRTVRAPSLAPDPSTDPAPLQDTDEGAARPFRAEPWRLPNGMTAIVVRDRSAHTVAARIVVRAGAADDPVGAEGTAHLLQHLMFTGTTHLGTTDFEREAPWLERIRALTAELAVEADPARREELEGALAAAREAADAYGVPSEVRRLLAAIGATNVGARTGVEHTIYQAMLPASALEPWAVLEAERFSDPVFRSFASERQVVEEELGGGTSCAATTLAPEQRAALFGDHPYAAPIGGTPESLERASLADLEAFFERHYVPENMAVVLVGDVDPAAARRILADTLGRLPPGPVPPRGRPPVPPQRGITRLDGEGHAEAAFLLTDLVPGDLEALRIAAGALGRDLQDRGHGRLRAPAVSVERLTDAAVLRVSGRCRADEPDACLRRIRGAVRTARNRGLHRAGLEAARAWAWVERLRDLESQEVQADQLARGWVRGESPADLWASLTRLHDLDPARVRAAVERRLSPDDLVFSRGGAKPSRRRRVAEAGDPSSDVDDPRRSALYDEILAIPWPDRPSGWRVEGRDFTRVGDRVLAVVNPSNTLFQAELRWPIGTRDEPALCEAVGVWLDARDWTKPLWRRGIALESRHAERCDWDSVAFTVEGPGSQAGYALRAVLDALREPRIGEPSEGAVLAARFARAQAAPIRRALFGPVVPVPDAPVDLAPAQLAAALRRLGATPPDVRYAGPHTAAEVAAMVPGGPRAEAPLAARRAKRTTVRVWPSHGVRGVALVRAGEGYDPAREPVYALYDRWLTGPAGVASEAIRAALGDGWQVSARYVRGERAGLPNVTEVRVTARTADVVDAARVLVDALVAASVDDARWQRVRDATDAHAWADTIPFREAARPLAEAFARGLAVAPAAAVWAGLPDIDRAVFEAFLEAEAAAPLTVVVTGVEADDPRLSALGPVEVEP